MIPEETLKHVTTGACVRVAGELVASRRRGAGRGAEGEGDRGVRQRRSGAPIPCRRRGTRWSSCATSPTCARAPTPSAPCSASATRWRGPSTASSRSAASSTCTRPSSRPRDAEGAGAMFGVTTLDLMNLPRVKAEESRSGRAASTTTAGLLRQARVPDRQRAAGGGDLRALLLQRLHLRPDVPRRELQHAAPPGRVLDDRAGDGVLRPAGQHAAGRRVSSSRHRQRDGYLPGRPGVLQQAHRQHGAGDAGERRQQRFRACHLHRGDSHPGKERDGGHVGSFRCTGARTCRASTSGI